MNSTSVDLSFHTLQSTLPKGQQALTVEEVRQLFDTALVEGGVWSDGQSVLVVAPEGQPGQSFTMNVAPQLAQPTLDGESLSMDTALALLTHLQTTLFQLNLVSNAMRAQVDSLRQEILLQEQRDGNIANMDARIAARASGRTAELSDGLAMGGTLLGVAVTIALAAFFTGGLALALVGVAVTLAVLEVGSAIAKAAGAKAPTSYDGQQKALDFTVAGMVQMAIDEDVKRGRLVIAEQRPDGTWVDHTGKTIANPTGKLGVAVMSPTQFHNYYNYTGLVFTLALGVGMMVGGFAMAKMALDTVKFAANVTRLNALLGTSMSTRYVQLLGNGTETTATFVEAATGIAAGGTQIDLAVKKNELEKLNIALQHLQAQIDFISQHMHLVQKIINQMMEQHNAAVVSTIRSIGQYYHGQVQIAHNLTPMS